MPFGAVAQRGVTEAIVAQHTRSACPAISGNDMVLTLVSAGSVCAETNTKSSDNSQCHVDDVREHNRPRVCVMQKL